MLLSLNLPTVSVRASAGTNGSASPSAAAAPHILRAAELADSSAGLTAPHPNFGCVIAHGPRVVGEGFLYAEGTTSAEVQAVARARDDASGAVAYLNLEPGDCHGDDSAIAAIKQARVSRVVVGLRHPLVHLRGKAINAMRAAGIAVDVLGEDSMRDGEQVREALRSCHEVNAPLLCRAVNQMPLSTLKYAMTLDGKIAASSGHAYWVSCKESRKRVFAVRGRSDAVIVGGKTVRRDNPLLTTREDGGHQPARIVMSKSLQLPDDLQLWDVTVAPTIVMTQTGARPDFQARLKARGVEIVEFDFLTPRAVVQYCYDKGFLSVLWECGGTLSAPAIAAGVIHKAGFTPWSQVLAFVAPKIIGGALAPSPVGELGMVEMTQALNLSDVEFEKSGEDMLIKGYLKRILDVVVPSEPNDSILSAHSRPFVINVHKTWEPYGALSNFSPHPVSLPDADGKNYVWKSVEHYYQAQRFSGVSDSLAAETVEKIQRASSPEEAARFGRKMANERPDLIRRDWYSIHKVSLYNALSAKFLTYPSLQKMLLSTEGSVLMEAPSSVKDFQAARGDANGQHNNLGFLLMRLRSEMLAEAPRASAFGHSLEPQLLDNSLTA